VLALLALLRPYVTDDKELVVLVERKSASEKSPAPPFIPWTIVIFASKAAGLKLLTTSTTEPTM